MRSIAVLLGLLLAGGLLLPACHEDWAPLHDELGRTADALGLVADRVGDSMGDWIDEKCQENCCELPTRQEFSRATRDWARSVSRDVGQGIHRAGDQLGLTAEQLAHEFETLGGELERFVERLGVRMEALGDALERFFEDAERALG